MILRHIEWWKRRLANLSARKVTERNRHSLAQIRVWGPAILAFIECASEHKLVSIESACVVKDAIRAWDDRSLATRLGIISFVVDRLTITLHTGRRAADKILGQFAQKLVERPHILAAAFSGSELGPPPGLLEHIGRGGISPAEVTHGPSTQKSRPLPRPVPRLRRSRPSTRR
jgi:hypothetical protein